MMRMASGRAASPRPFAADATSARARVVAFKRAFPRRQEEVGLDGVLLGVKIVVTAAEGRRGFRGCRAR